jgi:hypothetical protein
MWRCFQFWTLVLPFVQKIISTMFNGQTIRGHAHFQVIGYYYIIIYYYWFILDYLQIHIIDYCCTNHKLLHSQVVFSWTA